MVNKIIINDLELSPQNGYFIQAIRDLGYSTKYSKGTVLNYHGAILGNAYLQNKIISFELVIGANSYDELINKKNNLYNNLTIKEYEDDFINIEFYLNNGLILTCSGIIKSVDMGLSTDEILTNKVQFAIEIQEPFLKSKQIYEVNIPITKGAGGAIPMAIPFDMSQGNSGNFILNLSGNIFSYPVFYFYAPLTNPVLLDLNNNKSMAISLNITSGYIKVDTYKRIVVDDLGVNKRNYFTGDFLILNVGNNTFKLNTDNPTQSGYVKVIYQNFYISI